VKKGKTKIKSRSLGVGYPELPFVTTVVEDFWVMKHVAFFGGARAFPSSIHNARG